MFARETVIERTRGAMFYKHLRAVNIQVLFYFQIKVNTKSVSLKQE